MRDKSGPHPKAKTSPPEGESLYYEEDTRKSTFDPLDAIRSILEILSGKARSGRGRSSTDPEAKVSGK